MLFKGQLYLYIYYWVVKTLNIHFLWLFVLWYLRNHCPIQGCGPRRSPGALQGQQAQGHREASGLWWLLLSQMSMWSLPVSFWCFRSAKNHTMIKPSVSNATSPRVSPLCLSVQRVPVHVTKHCCSTKHAPGCDFLTIGTFCIFIYSIWQSYTEELAIPVKGWKT